MRTKKRPKGIELAKDEFKKELLTLLKQDDEVQKAVKKICKEKRDCEEQEKEIEMLKALVNELKAWICERDETIHASEEKERMQNETLRHYEKTIKKLQKEKEEKETQIEKYKNAFQQELEAYEMYKSLDNETKRALEGIFKNDSLQGFLACGVQEKNIEALWEYIKNEIIEEKKGDIQKLETIFDLFFERFTLAFPFYQRQEVTIGESFDPQKHINLSSLTPSGEIKQVVFRGWFNTKTGKIIKKSIVKL